MAKFRQENSELRDRIAELSTAGFEGDQSTVGSLAAIARLAEEAETYSAKIEVEKRRIAEMEKNIRECDMNIKKNRDVINSVPSDSELRKKVGFVCVHSTPCYHPPDKSLIRPHQIEKMDKNLEICTTRFASEISENKRARADINELRRERRRFKQVLNQCTNRYEEVDKQVHRIVAESQTWLQERAEYVDRIDDLKRVADTGQEEFLAQCRELKQVMRAFDSMEERLSKGEFEIPNHMGSMTAEQEEDLQKKVVKGKWQLAKEKAMTDLLKEQALSFEEAFEKLQVTPRPREPDLKSCTRTGHRLLVPYPRRA